MKIAITQRVIDFQDGVYDSLDQGFYQMFRDHTIRPIPNNLEQYSTSWIIDSDLIIFAGGNDILHLHNEHIHRSLRIEKHTLDIARLYNKPILGIGRGSLFLTAIFGGIIEKNNIHRNAKSIQYDNTDVAVEFTEYGESIKSAPPGASVLATNHHGGCESWKMDNIVAVRWNPERSKSNWIPYEAYGILGL
jgi:GMP synthase-like glutamine amidotransferase